jgi:S-(hydroxymethyl)glutathione dehydrogenase/alcohol dehydrogenase
MLTTRAAVLHTPGAPLQVETLELVPPGPGEVLIRLGATGICGTDFTNSHNAALRTPMVLGHEGAGVVETIGDGVTRCAVGDHVVLSLISQCGVCRWCVNGQPHLCGPGVAAQRAGTLSDGRSRLRQNGDDVYQFLGLGTFSERIVVQQTAVVPIRREVPLKIAALIGCGVLTGLGAALRVAPVPRGGRTLVLGCGGVGMNIIQGARIAGADRIIAVDTVAGKAKIARQLGATDFVVPDEMPEAVARATDGIGVDVAFDVVGSSATSRACIDATRRGGSICVVGSNQRAQIVISPVDDLIRGAKVLCGCNYGSSFVLRDVAQAVSALSTGALDLQPIISHTMRLDDINEGFNLIRSGGGLRTVIEY